MSLSILADVLAGRPVPPERLDPGSRTALLSRGLAPLWVAEARARTESGATSAFPPDLLAEYHRAAFRSRLILESTDRALEVLERAGVEALVFKGVALIGTGVYPDPGARPVEDVDLLVNPEATEAAVQALQASGFSPWTPWTPSRMGWVSSLTFSDTLAPPGADLALDLHWATPYTRLRQGPPWRKDPLWLGADPPYPEAAAHFAVVAEHFLKHLRVTRHLRGLGDLVRLLPRVHSISALGERSAERGSLPGLEAVLSFLVRGLEVSGPTGLETSGPAAAGAPVRELEIDRVLGDARGPAGLGGILGPWLRMQGRGAAAREILRVLVPPGAWLRSRYPASAGWRRLRYLRELGAWTRGSGPSPLSPNQEWV